MQKTIRKVLRRVAKRVEKNHLFEQPGERVPQEPIFQSKGSTEVGSIRLSTAVEIEERMLGVRVINHWATWCAPCVEELDILASIQSHIGADSMLGINWDLFQGGTHAEAMQEVSEVAKSAGLEYAQCIVTDQPDAFFAHFDLEEQLVPQTIVYSSTFETLFHRVGVLTEEDIATIVKFVNS